MQAGKYLSSCCVQRFTRVVLMGMVRQWTSMDASRGAVGREGWGHVEQAGGWGQGGRSFRQTTLGSASNALFESLSLSLVELVRTFHPKNKTFELTLSHTGTFYFRGRNHRASKLTPCSAAVAVSPAPPSYPGSRHAVTAAGWGKESTVDPHPHHHTRRNPLRRWRRRCSRSGAALLF